MLERERSYKGFRVLLFVPEAMAPGASNGRVQITGPNGDIGVRFTPDWLHPPETPQQAEEWLFAYAAGIIDCELAGGFGMDLSHE
ncbi:hypothetical protein LMG23992_00670 [Cupriavidus laharis]|uniref:Uncharacterized protein n=1 Tax=Cupriavidus laharis TaxID=151654 RepID=A0ABN7Y227_9BURK|nr:hypothetical protein [Cupriavidus laharis]CAG9166030.1 hypothetical protein LMG23992_00670 [Cupriavidus laharis]